MSGTGMTKDSRHSGFAEAVTFESALDEMKQGLRALQLLQSEYDKVGWDISDPAFHKFRHIAIHLGALTGAISGLCERLDHADARKELIDMKDHAAVLRDIASNIMFHMAQLANLSNFDLYESMVDRYRTNAKRFAPTSQFATLGGQP